MPQQPPAPAGEARAAEDHRGDDVELDAERRARLGVAGPRHEHEAGERRQRAAGDVVGDPPALDRHARALRGPGARADGVGVAPEQRARHRPGEDDEGRDEEDDDVRDAEDRADAEGLRRPGRETTSSRPPEIT